MPRKSFGFRYIRKRRITAIAIAGTVLFCMKETIVSISPEKIYPEPRGPRVLPVDELVLWYGMFAPYGRFLGTTGFARGAP